MRRDPRKYLYDVSVAADRVERFLEGKSFPEYEADELLRAGVERQFEIMGEALSQLSRIAPEIVARIPEYRSMIPQSRWSGGPGSGALTPRPRCPGRG